MTLKNQILVALGLNKAKSLRLEWQAKTDDGTILVSTADELTSGVDISVLTEDGTTIPLPAGSYTTDTGVSFRVEEEGIVAEVLQSEGERGVMNVTVTEITDDNVTLDANHPLAGKKLVFDVEVLEIV